jgi:phosphoglycerate dehydrogenase-like enzyme
MRPKILLLDEFICAEAISIFEQDFDFCNRVYDFNECVGAYVGLTNITPSMVPRSLKFVACPCTGIDHVDIFNPDMVKLIYLDDEWKRGVGNDITSTAEHTVSLILQLAKLKRMQLAGKTLGIIGYGRIGKQVASVCRTLFKKVVYSDLGVQKHTFEQVLQISDVVSLHVPLSILTKNMIGSREFKAMKDSALLVNTSRPDVVALNPLVEALITGKLGGYADDFAVDRIVPCKNSIQTPHVAGNSIEARKATDIYVALKACEYWRAMNND